MTTAQTTSPEFITFRKGNALFRKVYGVHFEDVDGNELLELVYPSAEERDAALQDIDALAPAGATTYVTWHDEQWVRDLIYGVDYGRGSLKHRFGGGHVPRNLYQYHRG